MWGVMSVEGLSQVLTEFLPSSLPYRSHAHKHSNASQAAEHELRLLACAVPALRLLRHCLGRLSDAGAQPPVGPLDAIGALLDFEVGKRRIDLVSGSRSPFLLLSVVRVRSLFCFLLRCVRAVRMYSSLSSRCPCV